MTADKKNTAAQNNNKRKYKAACNCEQPKNISRFRPYKKEKNNNKEKICEIKAAHIKKQNMCC
jgi:hypothetical protein